MSLLNAIRGFVDPEVAVVPIDRVYPPGETVEQVEQRTAEEMELSQQDATAAALRELDVPVATEVAVGSIVEDARRAGEARSRRRDRQRRRHAGRLTRRGARRRSQQAAGGHGHLRGHARRHRARGAGRHRYLPDEEGVAAVGIAPVVAYSFPFTVEIQIEDVGEPSAGLMFALGIYDKADAR